jgi:hypothetical protein
MALSFYRHDKSTLKDLIGDASRSSGPTLLIPDLQRPYVWSPFQVSLLIDSMLKGWPFGTLLLWSVSSLEFSQIPSRPFWKVMDRVSNGSSQSVGTALPPNDFRMVLDGQQRVQSLLLAFGGDDWGFRLYDADWADALELGHRPRGSHWSYAHLSLDLENFVQQFQQVKNVVWIDFKQALEWVINHPTDGQSSGKRQANYKDPVKRVSDHPGRYIRLSRLWNVSADVYGLDDETIDDDIRRLLEMHGIAEEKLPALVPPLRSLVRSFTDLKQTEIAYLRLISYDPKLFKDPTLYNDAIVNIFTRLNTAGRTLTRQEITFAWIKSCWDAGKTNGLDAQVCFQSLRKSLADKALPIEMDQVVKGISSTWSALRGKGFLLSDRDLLRGETIRPMATDICALWGVIERSANVVTQKINERDFEHQRTFVSLNAVFVMWGWWALYEEWLSLHPLKVVETHNLTKGVTDALMKYLDRWLVLTHWAGQWSSSTDATFGEYVADLAKLREAIFNEQAYDQVVLHMEGRLSSWIDALKGSAEAHVNGLQAQDRRGVRAYYVPLWIWHRLGKRRWETSRLALQSNTRKSPVLEVDHLVSVDLTTQLSAAVGTTPDPLLLNSIGNCSLLWKSFNVAKSAKPLDEFLGEVSEYKNKKFGRWMIAMRARRSLINPSNATTATGNADLDVLSKSIRWREERMKADLVSYIRGSKDRVDL